MKALLSERLALHGLLAIFLTMAGFHALVMAGVVACKMVWGGRMRDHSQMVTFEAASLTVTLLLLAVVAVQAGYVKSRISPRVMTVVFSLMFLLFLANTAGNLVSTDEFEKLLFTPLTLLAALFSLRVAMGSAGIGGNGPVPKPPVALPPA